MKKEDCIFCKIANGEIPSKTLYEDGDFRVILDLGPATRGHALILPREHADNLYELPEDTAAKVFVLAKKMATKMTEKLHCDGLNIVQMDSLFYGIPGKVHRKNWKRFAKPLPNNREKP